MGLNLDRIKNEDELKQVLKFLEDQGFGYQTEWELHNKKVAHIISKANTLNIKTDDKLRDRLQRLRDYDEIQKEVTKHFSQFKSDDKINEIINEFYLSSDEEVRTPYSNPEAKDIIAWTEFRRKYNLKNEFGTGNHISFYNLDKNYLKINSGRYDWNFKVLYELIFGEKPLDYNDKKLGVWLNMGKIEIKYFQNGKSNIKGELTEFKKHYYNYLKKSNANYVIKYNDKIEIIKHID